VAGSSSGNFTKILPTTYDPTPPMTPYAPA
jgi:hypothetical protein